jgi:hypothetical protein
MNTPKPARFQGKKRQAATAGQRLFATGGATGRGLRSLEFFTVWGYFFAMKCKELLQILLAIAALLGIAAYSFVRGADSGPLPVS